MNNPSILLVEDNPADVVLVREALKDIGATGELHVASDGQAAIDYLSGADRPDLILLDIELPGQSGLDILGTLKNDERYRSIPIVMMSASRDDNDIARAYGSRANSYIVKPVDFEQMQRVMRPIEEFWLDISEPPRGSASD